MLLTGDEKKAAQDAIINHHYTHSVPAGKSHYVKFGDAIVVWSIPANRNLQRFIMGNTGTLWELSRLWAPDGHDKNLLTQAISRAAKLLAAIEQVDCLVSYADPNVGHHGGVYRAASWIYHGKSEEVRVYKDGTGQSISRRAFHSGPKGLRKAEIEALGYTEFKLPGKERFVRPLSRLARKKFRASK